MNVGVTATNVRDNQVAAERFDMKKDDDSATLVDRIVMHSAGRVSLTVDVEQRFDLPNACVSVELVVRQTRPSHAVNRGDFPRTLRFLHCPRR